VEYGSSRVMVCLPAPNMRCCRFVFSRYIYNTINSRQILPQIQLYSQDFPEAAAVMCSQEDCCNLLGVMPSGDGEVAKNKTAPRSAVAK